MPLISLLSQATLRDRLAELVRQSRRIDIAVAWATSWNGLDQILQVATTWGRSHVRIIVGIGDYITTPEAMKKIDKYADFRIHGTPDAPLFHPKLYIFETSGKTICWVGSANLTKRAFCENTEAVAEFEDIDGVTVEYFRMLWNHSGSKCLKDFDLPGYEHERNLCRSASAIKIPSILEDDDSEAISSTKLDNSLSFLKSGWDEYLGRLRQYGSDLKPWMDTLDAGCVFVARDWGNDLSERETKIMFGHDYNGESFTPFGKLRIGNASSFRGTTLVSRKRRQAIGAALREVKVLSKASTGIIRKSFENLIGIYGCGPALATRLLVFTRPDWFVVVNKKSFKGLTRELEMPVNKKLQPDQYAKLVDKIQEQPWWRISRPEGTWERKVWDYRAALIDPLVYEESSDKDAE